MKNVGAIGLSKHLSRETSYGFKRLLLIVEIINKTKCPSTYKNLKKDPQRTITGLKKDLQVFLNLIPITPQLQNVCYLLGPNILPWTKTVHFQTFGPYSPHITTSQTAQYIRIIEGSTQYTPNKSHSRRKRPKHDQIEMKTVWKQPKKLTAA